MVWPTPGDPLSPLQVIPSQEQVALQVESCLSLSGVCIRGWGPAYDSAVQGGMCWAGGDPGRVQGWGCLMLMVFAPCGCHSKYHK